MNALDVILMTRGSALSPTERLVLVHVALYAGLRNQVCEASQSTLASDTGLTTRCIRDVLASLVRHGVLSVEVEATKTKPANYAVHATAIPARVRKDVPDRKHVPEGKAVPDGPEAGSGQVRNDVPPGPERRSYEEREEDQEDVGRAPRGSGAPRPVLALASQGKAGKAKAAPGRFRRLSECWSRAWTSSGAADRHGPYGTLRPPDARALEACGSAIEWKSTDPEPPEGALVRLEVAMRRYLDGVRDARPDAWPHENTVGGFAHKNKLKARLLAEPNAPARARPAQSTAGDGGLDALAERVRERNNPRPERILIDPAEVRRGQR